MVSSHRSPCCIVEYAMLAAAVHGTSLLLSDLIFLLISG